MERVKYDWNKATQNPDTRQQYELEQQTCFDTVSHDHGDLETMPKNMTEIFAEAAQKVIENPPKCGSKKWVTNVTPTLFTNRDNAKRW